MEELKDKNNQVVEYKNYNQSENQNNLTPNYYRNIIRGKTKSWIDIYVLNKLGQVEDGKPVYEAFRQDVHVARGELAIAESLPIYIGIDFGLTPACVFAQKIRTRRIVLEEIVAEDRGIVKFADLRKQSMAR